MPDQSQESHDAVKASHQSECMLINHDAVSFIMLI